MTNTYVYNKQSGEFRQAGGLEEEGDTSLFIYCDKNGKYFEPLEQITKFFYDEMKTLYEDIEELKYENYLLNNKISTLENNS